MSEYLFSELKNLRDVYQKRVELGLHRADMQSVIDDLTELLSQDSVMSLYNRGHFVDDDKGFDSAPLRLIEGQKVIALDDVPDHIKKIAPLTAIQMFGDEAFVKFSSVTGTFFSLDVYSAVRNHYEETHFA